MKRFLMMLVMTLTCLSFLSTVAEARRLGGGSSFGKSRAMPAKQAQTPPAATPSPVPASTGNKWMGPLAGLAVGAGLATMFANGGLGGMAGGMGSILMALLAAAVIMFLISKFKKANQTTTKPSMQYAGNVASFNRSEPMQRPSYTGSGYAGNTTNSAGNIPKDFPVDSFLRNAKMSFIRLQAANDRKDLNDIREYTTPEVFAEISMQMQERGNAEQKTDVVAINAELLEVVNEGDYSIASVRFTGQLSENKGLAENVDEIWHIQKSLQDANAAWLLAGIQQTNLQ